VIALTALEDTVVSPGNHNRPITGGGYVKNFAKVVGVLGTLIVVLAICAVGQSIPEFSPTVISGSTGNLSLVLNGYNSGSGLCGGDDQDCAYFRIGDPTCNKTNPVEGKRDRKKM